MPLQIVRNDITRMRVDAIVNAANQTLLGGGGVDGAIHRAAGPELLEECRGLGGCATGQAKLTRGYRLPCKYVIHTVGPVWRGGGHGEKALLAACYRNSLALADERGCETVAFPLISAGVYGYPKAEAMQVAIDEITRFLVDHELTVYIVVFGRDTVEIGGRLFNEVAAFIDDVYVERHTDARREGLRARRAAQLAQDLCFGESLADGAAPMPPFEAPRPKAPGSAARPKPLAPKPEPGLDELLDQVDEGFSQRLLRLIDERGMTDAACYKRANIDRRLFNKIKLNPGYRPGKQTALALAIALELDLDQTRDLLARAGYALTRSSKADIVVEYCIAHGNYNLMDINQVLFRLDLQPLGY